TSRPLVRRTRATLRSAEFGFLGVWVRTTVHTPRFCGAPLGCWVRRCFTEFRVYCSAGALLLVFFALRPFRTSWLIVGTLCLHGRCALGGRMFGQLALREAIADCGDGLAFISKTIQLAKATQRAFTA